jgi:hypothetical protein
MDPLLAKENQKEPKKTKEDQRKPKRTNMRTSYPECNLLGSTKYARELR